ncbi:MAG: AAA family ATPase, partial [Saprospiraceae bacterium]
MAKENNNTITNIAYLQKVHLKGYKSIYDVKIDLLPGLNIVIGPNGSGKSNFLEMMKLGLSREDSKTSFSIKSELKIEVDEYEWLLKVEAVGELIDGEFYDLISEKLKKNRENKYIIDYQKKVPFRISFFPFEENFSKEILMLRSNIFPKLLTFSIPQNIPILDFPYNYQEDSNDDFEILRGITTNFSIINSIIRKLISNLSNQLLSDKRRIFKESNIKEEFSFDQSNIVISSLQRFSPIKNIRINPIYSSNLVENNKLKANNIFLEFRINDKWLMWKDLSDGTKRLFYIIAEIAIMKKGVFLLEEPEIGIHPSQLHLLMNFLKEQSKTKQIIISTHSPQVLNILEEDVLNRIILTSYDPEKGTKLRKMKAAEIKKAKSYMDEEGLWLSDYWVHS